MVSGIHIDVYQVFSLTTQVDVEYVRHLKRFIPLKEMQKCKELSEMALIKRGRLSIQPVRKSEWDFILSLESKEMNIDKAEKMKDDVRLVSSKSPAKTTKRTSVRKRMKLS